MRVSRNQSARVIAGLLLAALLGLTGLAEGQEVSEHGNPWVRVTIGKVTVQAEAVRTPERLYLGLSNRSELPEGRGMLFFMPATGGADLLHAGDAPSPGLHLDQRRAGGGTNPERAPDLPGRPDLADPGEPGPGGARRICRPARDQGGGPGAVAVRGLMAGIGARPGMPVVLVEDPARRRLITFTLRGFLKKCRN